MELHIRTTVAYLALLTLYRGTTASSSPASMTNLVTSTPSSPASVTNPVGGIPSSPASVTNPVTRTPSSPASVTNPVGGIPSSPASVTNPVPSTPSSPASVTNPVTSTPSSPASVTSTAVGPNFFENLQNFLLNSKFTDSIQKQLGNFIKSNNVSLPISVMTPQNLQKLLQFLRPGSNSGNLQGISQYVGMLGNISNTIQNVTGQLEQQISPQCFSHLQHLVSELTQREQWAMKMIDATGKIPSGFMQGNLAWAGSFDECLGVRTETFDGQFCTATLPLSAVLGSLFPSPLGINVRMGVCIPDSCTENETRVALNALLGMVPLGKIKLQTSSVKCSEPPEYDSLAIGGFTVCGVFLALMVLSTLFDVMYSQHQKKSNETAPYEKDVSVESKYRVNGDIEKPSKPKQPGVLAKLAMAFSVYTNGRKLMSTGQPGGALGAVNGIRFLSISWVILGHVYSSALANLQNPSFMSEFMSNWTSMALVNALLSVDTFFTLSGLLVSYLFMKEMKKEKGRINWFMFYFHRFWRLTPVYMLVLFLDVSLFRYLGDGPFWSKTGVEQNFCKDTWWTNLLYINNVYKKKEMCMGWSWYLANDMQFYVVSPLLLVPLYFSKNIGLFVNFLALLGITIATGVVSTHYELNASMLSVNPAKMVEGQTHYFYDYYIIPWCRMGPYIVGIVTGSILYRTNCNYKIPKVINLVAWVFIAVMACLVLYGINDPVNGQEWSNGVNALYNAVHRSVWGMCVSWVIFACVTGNGGIVNDLLSWKLFVPLGRLSYCIYLTHLLVIMRYLSSLRLPIYATNLEFIFMFLGTLVMSVLVSIVASLAFEAPMMAIEKAIFRRGKK
ncbi:nose resistant to fluoxetine protein 6-like [Mizuhopecten yessoensis]|uniref:nose resistant to fluoxetine protein 6-like n=1 Tax=Mizuhopecten yessoensis TaxID=6573 RepID=UPI000B45715A|nr:nose resistant to fluoxetine protein 6-like [Mizuhopecten yessoensis]